MDELWGRSGANREVHVWGDDVKKGSLERHEKNSKLRKQQKGKRREVV